MSSLPPSEASSKGLWLTAREISALQGAEHAAAAARSGAARDGLTTAQGACLAAVAQSETLRGSSSWRARFVALATALRRPELVDPQILANGIIEAAPSETVPDENELGAYKEAALRFHGRAVASQLAGQLTTTVRNDEACSIAISVIDLVAAVGDLS